MINNDENNSSITEHLENLNLSSEQKTSPLNQYQYLAMHQLNLINEQAIRITTHQQYMAMFVLHLPFEQAVQITNHHQLAAMRVLGLSFETAIQIEEEYQLQNLVRFSYLPEQGNVVPLYQEAPPLPDHIIDFLRLDLLNSL